MLKRVVFLTPADAACGFRLTGVEQRIVPPEQAEAALLALTAEEENALVVVDERLLGGIAEERLAEIERTWAGLVVVLPAPARAETEIDYALRLVRRAIGYQMRVRT
jgi:vacuolar-type H+-ATPase subunit F/Vma7